MDEVKEPTYTTPDIEIDLRPYIRSIFNKWWLIGLFALLGAIIAILYALIQPVSYTAESNVSLLAISVEVTLDDRITTTDLSVYNDVENRPEALLAMAQSRAIRSKVVAEARQLLQLEEDESLPAQFQASRQGDLLLLTVTSDEPEHASLLANLWSETFVIAANTAFLGSGTSPESARVSSDQAYDEYVVARTNLEEFILDDQIDRLVTDYDYVKILLEQLYAERQSAFVLANTARVKLDNRLLNTTQAIVNQQVDDSVIRQLTELQNDYNYWYARKETLKRADLELSAVQAQLDAGMRLQSDIISENLATLINESGIARLGENNTFELDINGLVNYTASQIDTTATGKSLALRELYPALKIEDVVPAIEAIKAELIVASQEVDRLSDEILSSSNIDDVSIDLPEDNRLYELIDIRIDDLLNRTVQFDPRSTDLQESVLNVKLNEMLAYKQDLESQILNFREERQTLERSKTTAWEFYVSLDNQAREISTQFAAGAPQARLAVEAFPPASANGTPSWSLPAAIIIGGSIGLMIVIGQTIRSQVFEEIDQE